MATRKYMRRNQYNHQPGKEYCNQIGLPFWDEDFANHCDLLAREHGLKQAAWNRMVQEYAWKIKITWNPASYSVWQRIKFALFFLNPFHKKDK